ncbi:MAG: alpha/beta hydrolase [Opitutales bacterium]|nr:alpha/beta hydrolase [Opitutales bacterium]
MKKFFTICILLCLGFTFAKDIEIWKNVKIPTSTGKSVFKNMKSTKDERYTAIATPFLRYYEAKNHDNSKPTSAVLIFGGGGYSQIAIQRDSEPTAKLLSENGIACFVLAYRLPDNRDGALQDAQRALRLIYKNATKLNIDSEKIGVMGFSAGGHLAVRLSNEEKDFYEKIDKIDDFPKKPAFTILIYPAYLADKKTLELSPEIKVTKNTPPTFLMQTQDDKVYEASSVGYMLALREAGVPVDFHYFKEGGHGYALRVKGVPASAWSNLLLEWMRFNKFAK